jgi:hypothetical protein
MASSEGNDPVFFFECSRRPSALTSKTPPDDAISSISASGKRLRMAASRPEARGR